MQSGGRSQRGFKDPADAGMPPTCFFHTSKAMPNQIKYQMHSATSQDALLQDEAFSVYPHRTSSGQRSSQFAALFQEFFRDVSLGDDRGKNTLEFITQGDSLNGAERTGSVVSRADEDDVRLTEDLILRSIVSAVKEILDHAGHIAEVLRCPDCQAAAGQKIIEGRFTGFLQDDFRVFDGFRAIGDGLRHLLRLAGL